MLPSADLPGGGPVRAHVRPGNSCTLLAGAFTGNAEQQSCRRDVTWIPTLCVLPDGRDKLQPHNKFACRLLVLNRKFTLCLYKPVVAISQGEQEVLCRS